jgi:hypothetical protein
MVHLEIVCTQKWNSPGGLYLSVLKIPHAEVTSYGKYIKRERERKLFVVLCAMKTPFRGFTILSSINGINEVCLHFRLIY